MSPNIVHTQLANGLQVILKATHAAPVTSTYMWYRVGSRNEVEGHTGVSHWVEHMMFKGSPRFPKGSIMRAIDRNGGYVNAMTSYDFTAYYATLPSDRAELALEIEADRMRGAFFDPDEVEAERTVIIAEREGAENEPHYVLAEEMGAAAFRVHPYHHRTIGWKEDLHALTREQLYAHYQAHYVPNNAVLVVVGDLDVKDYLAKAERYFGQIPSQALPLSQVRPEPPSYGERRVTVRMPGSAPFVRIAYPAPPVSHADYMPMVVLDAVLTGGKAMFAFGDAEARSARLYRALVETELASSADSSYHPSLDPYLLSLSATVRDGHEAAPVEEALLEQVRLLQSTPVTAEEMRIAIRQTQAQFAYSSESVTSQALTLGFLEMVDHHTRMDGILDELAQVKPDDVMRVAQRYLTEQNRIVGHFVPSDEGDEGDESEGDEPFAYYSLPLEPVCFLSDGRQTISPETVVRAELDNGIIVLVRENWASASVSISAMLEAGSAHETPTQQGLAALTSSMLRRGTQQHTYQELNTLLECVGAESSFGAGRDDMEASGASLAEDSDLLIDTLAEILMTPTFPEVELAKLKGQYLTHLTMLDSHTGYQAERALVEALYGREHPYGRSLIGTRASLASLTRADLMAFHRAAFHPARMILSVVGAIEADHAVQKLANTLGQWHHEGVPLPWSVPDAPELAGIVTRKVEIPRKSQADLAWGVVGLPRRSPDYYAASMANLVLGRLGLMGRLGDSVRDQQGLAYHVSSSLRAGMGAHPWSITAGVQPGSLERATNAILAEVARLGSEPISDQEFDDCRSYLTGALPLRLETNDGISGYLLSIEQYGLGLDYLARYVDIILSVTKQDIQQVVSHYLTLDRYVLSMAGTLT